MCAKVLQAKETAQLCDENTELLKTFNIDTTTHIHPKAYCHKCHTIASKISSGQKGAVVETAVVAVSHGGDCWVWKGKAGRQKKGTKKRGRPKDDSCKNTVLKTAPTSWRAVQPLSLPRFLPPASSLYLQCKLCKCIVD